MDASYAPTALGRKVAEMNGIWNKLGPQAKLLFDKYPVVRPANTEWTPTLKPGSPQGMFHLSEECSARVSPEKTLSSCPAVELIGYDFLRGFVTTNFFHVLHSDPAPRSCIPIHCQNLHFQ